MSAMQTTCETTDNGSSTVQVCYSPIDSLWSFVLLFALAAGACYVVAKALQR